MQSLNLGPLAVPLGPLYVLAGLAVATAAGRLAGRGQQVRVGSVLIDMLLLFMLFGRVVFVALWFDQYRASPWSILNIRDGGFNVWGGLVGAALAAGWAVRRQPALRRPLAIGLAAGALVWGALTGMNRVLDPSAGKTMPVVALQALSGAPADLAALTGGKPAVVNLWASWCPPCRREMPVLAAAQQKEPGVNFVFINQGEDGAAAETYLERSKLTLSNVLLDPGSRFGHAAGSGGLPSTFFYDAQGRLVETHLGELSDATLAAKLGAIR